MELEENTNKKQEPLKQYCSFTVANRLFGVNILSVKEITSEMSFVKVFHTPGIVRGFMNIRGQIYLILDMAMILGFPKTEVTQFSKVIIFRPLNGDPYGVLVENIGDIIEASENQIEERRNIEKTIKHEDRRRVNNNLITGICKLKNNLMIIIDDKELLGFLK